jgi:nicotinamidase-related amidase
MHGFPQDAALVLIDVQQGFDDGSWGRRNNPEAESNIARLLTAWRGTQRPVFHVHHDSLSPHGWFRRGTSGHEPKPEARPLPGEPVFVKAVNSGFIGTRLEQELQGRGITTLVIAGITTNHCVSTTTRMAGNLGFQTYLVSDATAAFDGVDIHGRPRSAEDVHLHALSDVDGEFAKVVSTAWVLDAVAPMGAPHRVPSSSMRAATLPLP